MKPLISEELADALVEQIAHELYNASLYLYVASFLNGKGLSNLANHFISQHDEEQKHSMILFSLLSDLGIVIDMPAIDGCSMPINSIGDIANLYLERETDTTTSLNQIKELAEDETNGVVSERIREMILLQQDEYREATDFADKAEIIGNDWKFVLLWDASIKGV